MESLRDVRRVMEREVKKGSCPIMFDRLEFGTKPFQTISSEHIQVHIHVVDYGFLRILPERL